MQNLFGPLQCGSSWNEVIVPAGYKYRSPHQPQHPSLLALHKFPFGLPPSTTTLLVPQSSKSHPAFMTAGQSTHSYDPTYLGYPYLPHHLVQQQQTEPFWPQFNHIRHVYSPTHHPAAYGSAQYYQPNMQDFAPVFIGRNTAGGKILRSDEVMRRPRYSNELTKPFGRVSLFVKDDEGEQWIDDVRLQDLVRFSKTIGARFYSGDGAEDKIQESTEKLGFDVEVARTGGGGLRTVTLLNSKTKIWKLPDSWAFSEVIQWVWRVRNYDRKIVLPVFSLGDDIDEWELEDMIQIYAATVILDIRPGSVINDFRSQIIKRLAYMPTTAANFQFVHEHLPVGNIVVRKLIETFLMHGERGHYRQEHQQGEALRISEYVSNCGHEEFNALAVDIHQKRKEKADAAEGTAHSSKGDKRVGKAKGKNVDGKAGPVPAQLGREAATSEKAEAVKPEPAASTALPSSPELEVMSKAASSPKDSARGSPLK